MKKYLAYIFIISSSLLLLIISVYALFIDKKETEPITFKSGRVSYTIAGDLKTGFIVPGENIVTVPIVFTNNSTVDHNLKMEFSIKLNNVELPLNSSILVYEDEIVLGSNSSFDFNSDFIYDQVDGAYYYKSKTYNVGPSDGNITLFSNLYLNGDEIHKENNGEVLVISITLYVKQADNVSWSELGSINFETGLED